MVCVCSTLGGSLTLGWQGESRLFACPADGCSKSLQRPTIYCEWSTNAAGGPLIGLIADRGSFTAGVDRSRHPDIRKLQRRELRLAKVAGLIEIARWLLSCHGRPLLSSSVKSPQTCRENSAGRHSPPGTWSHCRSCNQRSAQSQTTAASRHPPPGSPPSSPLSSPEIGRRLKNALPCWLTARRCTPAQQAHLQYAALPTFASP